MSLRDILAAWGLMAPTDPPPATVRAEMMRRFGETVDRHAAAARRIVRSVEVQTMMLESNPDADDVKRLEDRRADIFDAWVKGRDADEG